MTHYFKGYQVDEETPVQYVGVYVTKWRSEWGEPSMMFAGVEGDEAALLDAAPALVEALECWVKLEKIVAEISWDHAETYTALIKAHDATRAALAAVEAPDET